MRLVAQNLKNWSHYTDDDGGKEYDIHLFANQNSFRSLKTELKAQLKTLAVPHLYEIIKKTSTTVRENSSTDENGIMEYNLHLYATSSASIASRYITLIDTYWSDDFGSDGIDFEKAIETATFLIGNGTFGRFYEYLESINGNEQKHTSTSKQPTFDWISEFIVLSTLKTTREIHLEKTEYVDISLCFYIPQAQAQQ